MPRNHHVTPLSWQQSRVSGHSSQTIDQLYLEEERQIVGILKGFLKNSRDEKQYFQTTFFYYFPLAFFPHLPIIKYFINLFIVIELFHYKITSLLFYNYNYLLHCIILLLFILPYLHRSVTK